MVLFKIPEFVQLFFTSILWRVKTKERAVYLTFDDGPTPEITQWVLETLETNNAEATFFCLGRSIEAQPDLFKEIILKNHQVGNHTYSHVNAMNVSYSTFIKEIEKTETLVKSDLFRPPYGKLTIKSFFNLRKKYRIVLWDLMSYDFDASQNTKDILNQLREKTRPGSIIVFHDSIKASVQLKQILPDYIQWLKMENYTCKKIV